MSGFMRLTVYRASYADYAPNAGGFADLRECDTVDESEELQRVSSESSGWFARYSAPGYMDQTDSVGPFKTASEAAQSCFDLFGDGERECDDIPTEDENELASVLAQIETVSGTSPKFHPTEIKS